MKKFLLIGAFLLILVAVPLTVFLVRQRQDIRQRAVPATSLYFEPRTSTHQVGDTFDLEIKMETGQNLVAAAVINVTYSALYLEAVDIVPGDFLPNELGQKSIEAGSVTITVGASTGSGGKQGTGTVAKITFKALAETSDEPTSINFGQASQVSAADDPGRNVLENRDIALVTITTGVGASPSPTPDISPSPSTSPQPSPSDGASPLPSATPSVSPTGAPSPTPSSSPAGQTTVIISPTNNQTLTSKRPTISGKSFPNALIVLTISNTSISTTFTADASGNWSFTPTVDLANGSYTVTVTGDDVGSGAPEVASANFTINSSTGGTTIASPTPSPTPTPSAGSSPTSLTSTTTTKGGETSTDSAIPVTGHSGPTFVFVAFAFLLLIIGALALL